MRLKLTQIIADEIASGTPLGKQAKTYVDAGEELPEQIAIPLIASRINKSDAIQIGWILEGYPTTRAQALALQAGGILPTHVLYFTSSSSSPSVPSSTSSPSSASLDESLKSSYDAYKRHGAAVQEVFSPVAHFLDLAADDTKLLTQLRSILHTTPKSHAPKRPLRVILLGPRGSGRHTQASMIAAKYGLVHVNVSALLKDEIRKIPTLAAKTQQYLQNGMLIPDEIVVPLVLDRLLASDTKKQGFILEGFPRTSAQAAALKRAAIVPNRVVLLTVTEEESRARVVGRRLDQETGDEYNFQAAAQEAALPSAIRDRLIHAVNDQEHVLEAINFTYNSFVDEVKELYKDVVKEIDGGNINTSTTNNNGKVRLPSPSEITRSKHDVMEQIETFLLNPLKNQYAHEAKKKEGQDQQ